MNLELELTDGTYAVCRLPADEPIPGWAERSDSALLAVVQSADELSIVCAESRVPRGVEGSGGWALLRVLGTLDHGLTGVLASIAGPLADAEIPIFAVSSFDTDYVLLPQARREQAAAVLEAAGHSIR